MAQGTLRVLRTKKAETVFDVHRWPRTNELPRTCSSRCIERERDVETATPAWSKPDDKDEIGQRLAPSDHGPTSGKDKGRVLYLVDRNPFTSKAKQRVAAVALLSVAKPKVFQLYRLCFNDKVISTEMHEASVALVATARELAGEADARLEMLVPPNAKPGDLCKAYGFAKTFKDGRGQTWMR